MPKPVQLSPRGCNFGRSYPGKSDLFQVPAGVLYNLDKANHNLMRPSVRRAGP